MKLFRIKKTGYRLVKTEYVAFRKPLLEWRFDFKIYGCSNGYKMEDGRTYLAFKALNLLEVYLIKFKFLKISWVQTPKLLPFWKTK